MAGLVGNIALGGTKRRCGGMPSLLTLQNRKRRRSPVSGCLRREGQRFESSQLHQVVAANRPGFPAPTVPRLFSALARKLMVCGVYSAGTTGLGRIKGFIAEILPSNQKIIRLARAAGDLIEQEDDEDGCKIKTTF
jgi:hypothetical protein